MADERTKPADGTELPIEDLENVAGGVFTFSTPDAGATAPPPPNPEGSVENPTDADGAVKERVPYSDDGTVKGGLPGDIAGMG